MYLISDVAKKNGILDISTYGDYIAKINSIDSKKNGKLVLVTAINPTPYGEGKTTVSIGLVDALNKLGINSCGALREPSLGPVFGVKGGATGGGKARIIPSTDINLHFTGDFHAVTSANNLLASAIDNHIYQGNSLGINRVVFKRCIDINDRSLRDNFNITAASEVMSCLCLAKDFDDLGRRLGNIIVGYTKEEVEIYARDLGVVGSMLVLLKDAIKPNLVQTLEGNPVLVHGGPFANISIGCSSVIATKMGLDLFDFVVTEAGFGADLGALKFLDIKCRNNNLKPDVVVLVATIRALKYNGGYDNLLLHIENLKRFGVNLVVTVNVFDGDNEEDIKNIVDFCNSNGVDCVTCNSFKIGSEGSIELAKKVLDISDNDYSLTNIYELDNKLEDKIESILKVLYHASSINYSEDALKIIDIINSKKINYPICIAKTQYSVSDDSKKLGYPKDYSIGVKRIEIFNGAELIVVYLNNIITMPGLSEKPNYLDIDIDSDGNVFGI